MKRIVTFAVLAAFAVALPWAAVSQQYSESLMLSVQVQSGDLPAVEDRLPSNPYVNTEQPEVGSYSTTVVTLPHESDLDLPFNYFVTGQHARSILHWGENMVQWKVDASIGLPQGIHPDISIEPNLAESWEVSADGREVTFHLRQGVRWSDGAEFTTEDIEFTVEDVINGGVIASTQIPNIKGFYFAEGKVLGAGGGFPEYTYIDKYTFKVTSKNPFPDIVPMHFSAAIWPSFAIPWVPKHYMKDHHPKYNSDATMEDWNSAMFARDRPPVLGAYQAVGVVGDKLIFERNPYYWKVDIEGNQLPYFDKVVMKYQTNGSDIALGLASNELWGDFTKASTQEAGVIRQNEGRGNYTLLPFNKVGIYQGLKINLETPKEGLAELFQNRDFALALSTGLDTDAMGLHTCLVCPAYKPLHNSAMLKVYPQYADSHVETFDRAAAMATFDSLGLTDSDGDGYREYPSGSPQAGENIGWMIVAPSHDWMRARWIEGAGEQFNEMGFKVEVNPMNEVVMNETLTTVGMYDMRGNSSFQWGGWTNQQGFEATLQNGGGLYPANDGDPNPLLERTKGTDLWDWQLEGMAIRDGYFAGDHDLETAMDAFVAWGAENAPRQAFARGGVTETVVVDNTLANMPYFYHPVLRRGGIMRQSWDQYVAMRIWQWFEKPDQVGSPF